MAYSYINYTGDGSQVNYSVPYSYLLKTHVKVYVEGLLKTVDIHYSWLNDSVVQFVTAPALDEIISIKRMSNPSARLVDFQTSSILDEDTLDLNSNQLFYLMQEGYDALALASGEESAIFTTPQAILDAFVGSISLAQLDPTLGAAVGYLNTNYINDAIYEFDEDGTVVYEDEVYHHGYTKLVWIDGNLLVTGTVLADAIAVNAVTADKIFAGSVTALKVAAGAIEATHMAIDSILAASIKAGEIDTGHLAADCITADEIEALAVDTEHLAAGCITAAKIDALAIEAGHIAADAITGTEINATNLSGIFVDLGTITAGNITLDSSGFIRTTGKDNYADETAGFFLGYDSGAYKFNLGKDTHFFKFDGNLIKFSGHLGGVLAGTAIETYSDTERTFTNTNYEKKKEMRIGRAGTWRISFAIAGEDNSNYTFAKIYKNGEPYGTERSKYGIYVYETFTEDLAFDVGDTCEIWVRTTNVKDGWLKEFRALCDAPIITTVIID